MSNNKQSSVEWLYDNLNRCFEKFDNGEYSYTDFVNASKEVKQQAKAMHKEEIIKAFDEGQEYEYQYHINSTPKFDSETYYNETYGGNRTI